MASSSKRTNADMDHIIEHGVQNKQKKPKLMAQGFADRSGAFQQANYQKCGGSKVLKDNLSGVLPSVPKNSKNENRKSLKPVSDTYAEINLELIKPEKTELISASRSLRRKDLEDITQSSSVQVASVDEQEKFSKTTVNTYVKARNGNNLQHLSSDWPETQPSNRTDKYVSRKIKAAYSPGCCPNARRAQGEEYSTSTKLCSGETSRTKLQVDIQPNTGHGLVSADHKQKFPDLRKNKVKNLAEKDRGSVASPSGSICLVRGKSIEAEGHTKNTLRCPPSYMKAWNDNNLQHLSLDSSGSQPPTCPDKCVSRKIKASYSPGCGPNALRAQGEGNASTKLCSSETSRTKLQVDIQPNTRRGLMSTDHKQRYPDLRKNKVKNLAEKDRGSVASPSGSICLVGGKSIEAEGHTKNNLRCPPSYKKAWNDNNLQHLSLDSSGSQPPTCPDKCVSRNTKNTLRCPPSYTKAWNDNNLQHLSLDLSGSQPPTCPDKCVSRKIKASYSPGCGPNALRAQGEENASTKLCSSETSRTKLQVDIQPNTRRGLMSTDHKQRYPDLRKNKVKSLAEMDRTVASSSRSTCLVGQKSIEAEGHSKKIIACPPSYSNSVCVKQSKIAEDDPRGENEEVIEWHKIKKVLSLFQLFCRVLRQKSNSDVCGKHHRWVHYQAFELIKKDRPWIGKYQDRLGSVPGIDIGDTYDYRIELHLMGLHQPTVAGISYMKIDGENVATSIVSSEGYNDLFDSSGYLVYEGEGGHTGDQKRDRGNLALYNSIENKTPVRVILGSRKKMNSLNGKSRSSVTYVYDGLYTVQKYWSEKNNKGFSVFKFKLKRIPNQKPLPQKEVLMMKQKNMMIGLRSDDISTGEEVKPIPVVNTFDNGIPKSFIYQAKIKYPPWYKRTLRKGCNCIGKCSNRRSCACAVENGRQFPFTDDGTIVRTKPLIFECGPCCSCSPSCLNRVSQHGIKFELEVFKTKSRGWGVRSLASIPSGGFVCEYTGELLTENEAQMRTNDEYMFQIGHNYNDLLPKGVSNCMAEIMDDPSDDMDYTGLTIDAFKYGNIARFINHSCCPNLYAQNVLYDHDDKKAPHIMLFAIENIPPFAELCFHYNYNIGQVFDRKGNVKTKACYCNSPACNGRLY